MKEHISIDGLFKEDKKVHYDFSQSPALVRLRDNKAGRIFDKDHAAKWEKAQNRFLRWTKDWKVFSGKHVRDGKLIYDGYFKKRGCLVGSVLDIGGGWGLFKEWWEKKGADIFIVHDPGIERFLCGPHALHREYYKKAFSLPMTFVEGFGEDLPYKDGVFDLCLISAALDHCVWPDKVMQAAYWCIRPGGIILIIQRCLPVKPAGNLASALSRLKAYLLKPERLPHAFFIKLFYRNCHLHHFSAQNMTALLEQAGFSRVGTEIISQAENIYAFEAEKRQDS